ncbi:EAL domain-containing protein [Paraglaciecola aquimarina]|uniref:EAL domain-containing protein n=1 Tax=Paraglaciecola algarum TaxID=3050085 RepID=A0ABS9D809_9ALTE|nr:EAL domain-containing protein [Paraglaciecola sp. G1-23]MCF2949098.1 EAL domain-containing protein [Paraglaciecola sp. G1-23]
MCLLLTYRLADLFYWQTKLRGSQYDVSAPMRRFIVGRYLTAFTLSVYSILFFDSMDVIELSCTLVVMSAMAGGAATVLAANKALSLSYAAILLIPLSLLCLFSTEDHHNIFGVLGFVFVGVMMSSARLSSKFTMDSILIKNQNSDLLKEMELKNAEIAESNLNLEEKVKSRTQEILTISRLDPLTKLFNRNAFSESLKLLIAKAEKENKPLALLFIDLDGFKNINDSHGHAVGDDVLTSIAHRLYMQAQNHEFLCRWGGDEFLIALQHRDEIEAKEFSTKLIHLLSQPIRVNSNSLSVGATIGIAMYPKHSKNEQELIELADTAMYAQKQTSKSDVRVFNDVMRESINRENRLKDGLSRALQMQQMYVTYQPVIDSQTGQVCFCEALLRWKLDGELIPPNEFIPIAEQNGFIHDIGSWVLQQACKVATKWTFDNTVNLSVNVSVSQLMHNNMLDVLEKTLKESGFPAEKLHIEITESIFVEDIQLAIQKIKALQKLKIKVSVDDFGTGFSSLSLLQSIAADVVKIDKNFIASMAEGGTAVIQATQHMAKELGYSVVAEGVETKAQADALISMGIQSLQGYYYSKPMRQEELENWHELYRQDASK